MEKPRRAPAVGRSLAELGGEGRRSGLFLVSREMEGVRVEQYAAWSSTGMARDGLNRGAPVVVMSWRQRLGGVVC